MSKEKTAIQQLIEYDDRLISNGRDSVSADLILNLLRKKMVELRDTVEKEQLIKAADSLEAENVRKANIIFKRFGVELLCEVDENAGLNYYNEKYGSDETQI